MSFQETVTLPNRMVFAREFDWNRYGRWDLFATDGKTRLARGVESICFNDRYVWVSSYKTEGTGLYDAETDARLDDDGNSKAMLASGLSGGNGCNGYYTAMIGPGLLSEGNKSPFLPLCKSLNLNNPVLTHHAWFERPCNPGL